MSAMTGAAFDREYTKMMVSDHRKDVSDFEKESTRGTDADLKEFATRTLPTLQEHPGTFKDSTPTRQATPRPMFRSIG